MRVLFLSPRQLWPVNSGAKLRDYHLARCLSSLADITLLSFASGAASTLHREMPFFREIVAVPPPRTFTPWKVVRGILGTQPLPILNYTSAEMQQALDAQLRKHFDFVQIESANMAGYAARILRHPQPPRLVYDWHNIESEILERYSRQRHAWPYRLYARQTVRRLKRVERDMLAHGAAHLVCSERERAQLQALAPRAPLHVIANGVDISAFVPPPAGTVRDRLLFAGIMNYHANIDAAVDFAHRVWPHLHAAWPRLRLTLAGADPVRAVRSLASLPGIEVTGTVPDLRPYYHQAVAAIAPLRVGGGTRLKILEALAAGVPVVSTPLGAEGLDLTPGEHILLAESHAEWQAALQRILDHPEEARCLAEAGRHFARRYDWNAIGAELCRIYRELDQRGSA